MPDKTEMLQERVQQILQLIDRAVARPEAVDEVKHQARFVLNQIVRIARDTAAS